MTFELDGEDLTTQVGGQRARVPRGGVGEWGGARALRWQRARHEGAARLEAWQSGRGLPAGRHTGTWSARLLGAPQMREPGDATD